MIFKFKLKTGLEVITIKMYIETVTSHSHSLIQMSKLHLHSALVALPSCVDEHIEAKVIDEVRLPLKTYLLTLAHQERVHRCLVGERGKISDFKFGLQWIHNKTEYQLKRLVVKASKLEDSKDRISLRYHKAKQELEAVQKDDGTSIAKKLLHNQKSFSKQSLSSKLRKLSDTHTENSKSVQYLSFSESEEEEKVAKDNITTCSSSQSKLFP